MSKKECLTVEQTTEIIESIFVHVKENIETSITNEAPDEKIEEMPVLNVIKFGKFVPMKRKLLRKRIKSREREEKLNNQQNESGH